jgi:hypothetical protein
LSIKNWSVLSVLRLIKKIRRSYYYGILPETDTKPYPL